MAWEKRGGEQSKDGGTPKEETSADPRAGSLARTHETRGAGVSRGPSKQMTPLYALPPPNSSFPCSSSAQSDDSAEIMNSFLAAVSDVKDLVVAELSRVFPAISPGNDDHLDQTNSVRLNIPTAEQVENRIRDVKAYQATIPQQPASTPKSSFDISASDDPSSPVTVQRPNYFSPDPEPGTVSAVQRDALHSLTILLSEPASPGAAGQTDQENIFSKIDVLETICKLLFTNRENQAEFRRMDGYTALAKAFDEGAAGTIQGEIMEDESSDRRRESVLQNAFNVIFTTVVDGNQDGQVGNYDALEIVGRMAVSSSRLDVRQHAINCLQVRITSAHLLMMSKPSHLPDSLTGLSNSIPFTQQQDLVTLNPLNAVAQYQLGVVDALLRALSAAVQSPGNRGAVARTLGVSFLGFEQPHHAPPLTEYRSRFADTAPAAEDDAIIDASPVYGYIASVARLLDYVAVILSEHNVYILLEYTRLIMEIELPAPNITANIIMRSVAGLIGDLVSRHRPVDDKFLSIYLQLIRRIHHMDDPDRRRREQQRRAERAVVTDRASKRFSRLSALIVDGVDFLRLDDWETEDLPSVLDQFDEEEEEGRGGDTKGSTSSLGGVEKGGKEEEWVEGDEVQRSIVLEEQHLLLLYVVGLLVEAGGRDFEIFDMLQGFEILSNVVVIAGQVEPLADAPADRGTRGGSRREGSQSEEVPMWEVGVRIPNMALWMAREYMMTRGDWVKNVKWVIKLLKSILTFEDDPQIVSPEASTSSNYVTPSSSLDTSTLGSDQSSLSTLSAQQRHQPLPYVLSGNPYLYAQVCKMVSSLLRKSDIAKQVFGECGGMQILLAIFSNAHDPDVATFALRAAADFFSGHEGTKQLLEDTYGYDGFLELMLASPRPFDQLTCEIILEVSTVGNVARAINLPPVGGDGDDPFPIHEDIMPYIAAIMEPQALFEAQLPYTCAGRSVMKKKLKNGQTFRQNSKQSSRPGSVRSVRTSNDESTSKRNSLHNMPPFSDDFRRPSGEYSDGNGLLTGSSSGHHDRLSVDESRRSSMQLPSPTLSVASPTPSIASSLERTKNDMFLNKQTMRRKRNNIISHPSVTDPSPLSRTMIRNLTDVVFRDNDAALMVMKFLARVTQCEDIKLQNDFFSFLMLLLELNPRNKQYLCANQGVTFMIELLFLKGHQRVTQNGYHYETEMPPYVDIVAALGTYSITTTETALLFDAAFDPLGMFGHLMNEGFRRPSMTNVLESVLHDPMKPLTTIMNIPIGASTDSNRAKTGDPDIQQNQVDPFFMAETQMQMLYAMERISERTDPAYYFSFDGCDGTFITFPLDKFPAVRIGYTVSCWIKVTTFLENETGVLCFEDPLGDYTLFELYFKTLDMSNRQCLCVRMQHHPLPPEDFVFDGFDFSDTGVWHHIAFVHGKQGTSLFVDGCSISAYSTFSYPRPTGKEKPFCAVLGRRGRRFERSMSSLDMSSVGRPSVSSDVASDMDLGRRATVTSITSEMNMGRRGTVTSIHSELNIGRKGTVTSVQPEMDMGRRILTSTQSESDLGRRGTLSSIASSFGRPSMSSDALSSVITQSTVVSDVPASDVAFPRASTTSFMSVNSSPGFFCGQMGCVYIMKGLWDQTTAEKVYNEGPGYFKGYRALGIDNQHATVIHPLAYGQDPKSDGDRSSMNSIRSSFTATDSLTRRSWDSIDVAKVVGRPDGGCSVHRTLPMKDIIEELGGVELVFRFLEMEPHQHLPALRTISNLLYKHAFNQARFLERRGYQTLETLLKSSASFLTVEHFDILWDIVSNGIVKNNQMLIVNLDALRVIVDVVVECEETVQLPVVRTLVDMLVEVPENLKQWRLIFGLETLFELLNALSATLRPFVMRALGAMVEDISAEELTRFFDFITHDQRQYLDVKAELLEMVFRRMTYDATLVERVRASKSLQQLIPLLELPNERFRMTVLRIMGVLMSSNSKQSRTLMIRINGFESMRMSLAPFPLSMEFAQALIGVALNHYCCDPALVRAVGSNGNTNTERSFRRQGMVGGGNSPRATSPRASPRSSEDSLFRSSFLVTEELMWPEIIKLIIELLRTVENGDLVYHILTEMKRLLNEENMKVLWEHPWFEWVSRFLQYRSMMGPSNYNRIHSLVDSIIQKMMVFDLSRKNSYISKSPYRNLFVATDTTTVSSSNNINDDMFQLSIIENVLSYLDKHPNLNIETATYVFKNLVSLYKHLEAVMADNPVSTGSGSSAALTSPGGVAVPAPSLSSSASPHNRAVVALAQGIRKARRHFAETINLLACHNTSVIRTTMKSSGLFRIRDGLVKEFGLDLEEQAVMDIGLDN